MSTDISRVTPTPCKWCGVMKLALCMILLLTAGCYVKWKSGADCYAFEMIALGDDPCQDKTEKKLKEGDHEKSSRSR